MCPLQASRASYVANSQYTIDNDDKIQLKASIALKICATWMLRCVCGWLLSILSKSRRFMHENCINYVQLCVRSIARDLLTTTSPESYFISSFLFVLNYYNPKFWCDTVKIRWLADFEIEVAHISNCLLIKFLFVFLFLVSVSNCDRFVTKTKPPTITGTQVLLTV